MFRWLIVLAASLSTSLCFAQPVVEANVTGDFRDGTMDADGTIRVGPDAKDRAQIFTLLIDVQIQRELQMDSAQVNAVQSIMREHNAATVKLVTSGNESGSDIQTLREAQLANFRNSIEELLLPDQLKRLEQLVYRMEVGRVGFAASLTSGLLGRDAGVYEGQKEDLYRTVKQIELEAQVEIRKVLEEAEKRILARLTPEQRQRSVELLGTFFEYKSLNAQQRAQMSLEAARAMRPTVGAGATSFGAP